MGADRQLSGLAAKGAIALTALLAIGCEASTEPPSGFRLEAVTPTDLTGVQWRYVEPVPTVRVLDRDGSPVGGVPVHFQIKSGMGAIGESTVVSAADGRASVGWWTVHRAGWSGLTARSGDSGDSRVSFTVEAEAWRGIERVMGGQQAGTPGQALPQHLGVLVVWSDDGWPLAGAEVTYTVVSGGGSIEGGSAVTDSEGYAESGAWTLGPEVGQQQVLVESGPASIVFVAYANEPL